MQHKKEAYEQIKKIVATGDLSKEEIIHYVNNLSEADLSVVDEAANVIGTYSNSGSGSNVDSKNSLMTKILYVIGGIITLAGVLILLSNNWDALGFIGQWCITTGLGLALYINACMTAKKKDTSTLSQVLFTVSSILLFWGGYVWYEHVFNPSMYYTGVSFIDETLLIGLLLFVIFASALYAFRKPALHLISGVFFSVTYCATIAKLLSNYYTTHEYSPIVNDLTIYSMMVLGLGYIAYGFWLKNLPRVYKIYSFFGFGTVLVAGLLLDGIWNLLYAFLAIGSIALSIRIKNTIGLILTSIAIGIYCIKISVTYFVGSLGFPFILLCSGLLIIALGYLTYYLNKKYINQQ